ncbi:MAG: phage antirepressor KilAC domain-containing protein, partial [Ruthenibacterium sp.]
TIRKTGGYVCNDDLFINTYLPHADPQSKELFRATLGTIRNLNSKIEQDKPKVLFADAVATARTSILVGELAKILNQNGVGFGQNRLFTWMRENGYLIRRNGTDYNMPTQRAMELGLFEIKETVIAHADGHTSTSKTPKITGKGQQYFVSKLLGGKTLVPAGFEAKRSGFHAKV